MILNNTNKIIWIASYLKSGNTWIRSFLSSYLFTKDGSFNFDLLKNITQFESNKFFSRYIDKEYSRKHPAHIAKYWIKAQKEIKIINGNTTFLKTHNFFGSLNNYPFTNTDYTRAFIYIIRDPREIVISYSNFSKYSIEKSLEIILKGDQNKPLITSANETAYPVVLYNWSVNYLSWKNFKSVPNIIVKYEDLVVKTEETLFKIISFLSEIGIAKIDRSKFIKSMENTSFKNLSEIEKKYGFKEFENRKKRMFFNKGLIDSWKKILSNEQIFSIEKKYKDTMQELGYL